MKVFISQPMAGKTEEQIKLEREKLTEEFTSLNYEVIDSVFKDFSKDKSPIYYLAKSIELLDKADIVVFMNGWDKARGCRIEYEVAKEYGKTIVMM